jgi:hypothetical protein
MSLRPLACGVDRGGEHDGSGIIGQQDGNERAHAIDQSEKSLWRAVGMFDCNGSEPIEQPFLPRELGDQHHAGEKIDR